MLQKISKGVLLIIAATLIAIISFGFGASVGVFFGDANANMDFCFDQTSSRYIEHQETRESVCDLD